MKITNVFEATFISVKQTTYMDRDNRPVISNYVALESNNDVGNILCTEDVKNELLKEKKYTEMKFQSVYDSYQKSLIIVGFCHK